MTNIFISMFYIIIGIAISVLLIVVGLILLIRGFLFRYLAEYAGKKTPKILITTGIVLMSLPVLAFSVLALLSITSSVTTIYSRTHYESVPDVWRHEFVTESQAEDDIVKALLTSADKGGREAFCRNFTPELQKSSGFERAVNQFFALYPVGLSECVMNDKSEGDTDSGEREQYAKTDSLSFNCTLNDQWYLICVEYCYRNTAAPDKVGVTRFTVMNLEAAAVYHQETSRDADYLKDAFLLCDVKSSREVNARLIAGTPYVWTPTTVPLLKADELRVLLKDVRRLDDPALTSRLGQPNIGIKRDDSTEYGYFFQLANQNGEPRYAYFQTESEYGGILYALLCTPYEVDYDYTLFEGETSGK